jgi:hypothetical protein
MVDMLIKLYDLEDDWRFIAQQKSLGITIRKPIGPEKQPLVEWVSKNFSSAWASEADVAFSNTPRTCFVAVKAARFIGFACYDATALGFFGPIGVKQSNRNASTGRALMRACLLDMKLKGYGYAIAGNVADPKYYIKNVGAKEISNSDPGIYKARVKNPKSEKSV